MLMYVSMEHVVPLQQDPSHFLFQYEYMQGFKTSFYVELDHNNRRT